MFVLRKRCYDRSQGVDDERMIAMRERRKSILELWTVLKKEYEKCVEQGRSLAKSLMRRHEELLAWTRVAEQWRGQRGREHRPQGDGAMSKLQGHDDIQQGRHASGQRHRGGTKHESNELQQGKARPTEGSTGGAAQGRGRVASGPLR